MFKDIEEALRFIKDKKIAMVDLKTADLPGRWRHMVYKSGHNDEMIFSKGTGTSLTRGPRVPFLPMPAVRNSRDILPVVGTNGKTGI